MIKTVGTHLLGLLVVCSSLRCQSSSSLQLTSDAFKDNDKIPAYYTCDNADAPKHPSPALRWGQGPNGTKAYGLMVEDPDAQGGTYYHWIVYNLPETTLALPESASIQLPALEAKNSSGSSHYVGPCPPLGEHRYIFTVYALSQPIEISQDASPAEIKGEMEKYALAQGVLTGRYTKVVKQSASKQ